MRKVVFLDRDGVINKDRKDYTWRIEDFEILPNVVKGCRNLHELGYEIIIITNQGGIAKGLYSHEDVEKLHQHMRAIFQNEGVSILEIYYCPHHSDYGKCLCRKPGSLMVEKAIARFEIDKNESFFIGDMDRDLQAAHGVGIKGHLVETNSDFISNFNQFL
ncbi:MAG: D-glycero-alpha-D-manno-heptose-1,7-bisphosphate 7-phosphatase [Bacteroidota bacterium]